MRKTRTTSRSLKTFQNAHNKTCFQIKNPGNTFKKNKDVFEIPVDAKKTGDVFILFSAGLRGAAAPPRIPLPPARAWFEKGSEVVATKHFAKGKTSEQIHVFRTGNVPDVFERIQRTWASILHNHSQCSEPDQWNMTHPGTETRCNPAPSHPNSQKPQTGPGEVRLT